MTNQELVDFWSKELDDQKARAEGCDLFLWRTEAIKHTIKALEQIEEMKRLCEKALIQEYIAVSKLPGGQTGHRRGEIYVLNRIRDFLNGNPLELKELAGEE